MKKNLSVFCSTVFALIAINAGHETASASEPQTVLESCKQIQTENKPIKGLQYGVFDSNLHWLLQPVYREIIEYAPNYFFVIDDATDQAALIDTNTIPHKKYDLDSATRDAGDFRTRAYRLLWLNANLEQDEDPRKNLLLAIGHEGAYGLKRATGQILIKPEYDDIVYSDSGREFLARRTDKNTKKSIASIIDSTGAIREFADVAVISRFNACGISTIEAQVKPGEPQRFGLMNHSGKVIYPVELSYCTTKLNNAFAHIEKNGSVICLVIDKNGKEIIRTTDEALASKISDDMDKDFQRSLEKESHGQLKMKWIDNKHHAVVDSANKYVLPPSSILLQQISNNRFIANLLGPDWQHFYPNEWNKNIDGNAPFAHFLQDFNLIGMTTAEVTQHLGSGDLPIEKDASGDQLLTYQRMATASLQIKLHKGKVSAWRAINKDHQEPWIEKNVLIPDTCDGLLTNVAYAVTKQPGAELPKGKVWPPGSNE